MIELTREAVEILKSLCRVEGFLFSVKDSYSAIEFMDYPTKILTDKLSENKE